MTGPRGSNPKPLVGVDRELAKEDIAQLYGRGMSIRKIAERIGRSYGLVHQLLLDAGVELRSRGGDQSRTEQERI